MACHGLFTLHVRISDNTGFSYRKNIGRFNREFSEQFSSLLHQLVTLPFGPFEQHPLLVLVFWQYRGVLWNLRPLAYYVPCSIMGCGMKIVEVRGYRLRYVLPEPVGNSLKLFRDRDAFLIEVIGDTGIRGWGEVLVSPDAASTYIRTTLAPILLGENPRETGRLWRQMVDRAGFDRRGVAIMSSGGVDIALHDLAARDLGIPLSALLGGAVRKQVLAYASGPFFKPDGHPYRNYEREVEGHLKAGFTAIKPRAGLAPREDGKMARALRSLVGPDASLMMDFNQGYTAPAAIESAHRMREADLLWIEEPVQPEDIVAYQNVIRAVPVAVAGGEAWASLSAFRDFITQNAVSIVQPDLAFCGGFTGFQCIQALAEAFDIPVVPHVWGTTVNFHAALHVNAVLPAYRGGARMPFPFMEYDVSPNPFFHELGIPPLNADGTITIPDEPGLGLTLSGESLQPWLIDHWSVHN